MNALTAHQLRALRLIADGLTAPQAGERLGLSPSSTKGVLDRAKARLGAVTLAQAVHLAHQSGQLS